ncbi:hypothetical protein [Streptomyces sp. NPDC003697]
MPAPRPTRTPVCPAGAGNVVSGLPLSTFDRLRDLSPVGSPTGHRAALVVTAAAAVAGAVVAPARAVRRSAHR